MSQVAAPIFVAKRGRPTAAQAASISNAIVMAATELFLAKGFIETTMDEIAARAGVPKSTIYKRHEDKAALLRFVILARIEEWSNPSDNDETVLPPGLEARLKHYAAQVLSSPATRELEALSRLTKDNWPGAAEVAEAVHQASYVRMVDFLEQEIVAYAEAGTRLRHARRIAESLMALLSSRLAASGSEGSDPADDLAFANYAVELLIYGRAVW